MGIGPRQVVACVGRNGAGKSTLLKTIAGFLKPLAGSVTCGGVNLVGRPSYDIAKLGIKYVPQDKKVFSDLTVRENLELGSYATQDYNWGRVTDYFPKLKELMDRKAGFLSGGERQMLMIGRALLGSPKVLLIDEPTEGLAPKIVEQVAEYLTELQRRGVSVLLVEQKLTIALQISGRCYVMGHGSIVFEGTPAELRAHEEVRKEWLEV
jgi:branched-chain amino acid transport system ATP-binding protein